MRPGYFHSTTYKNMGTKENIIEKHEMIVVDESNTVSCKAIKIIVFFK